MRRRTPSLIPQDTQSGEDEMALLFDVSARILIKSTDRVAFLDWIEDAGPMLARSLAAMVDPKAGSPGLAFRSIGVEIYHAMPLPELNYQRPALQRPGRNGPCVCGSGKKYKHCCLPLAGILDLKSFNMLRFILDNLPRKVYTELPASAVDLDMVWDTAMQWAHEGDMARAAALLEPWFTGNHQLTGKLTPLFEQLMNCYLDLGHRRKRERLLTGVIARGDRELRSAALQRRAAMLTDRGDFEAAWAAFREAQQENPDDPGLALLEITLLISDGNTDLARERARFWAARMQRSRHPDQDLIAYLQDVTEDPIKALAQVGRSRHPEVDRLAQLFAAAPPVELHYRVESSDAGCFLVPDAGLISIESAWAEVFPQIKPHLTSTQHGEPGVWEDAPDWLPFLERFPLAWQSFNVLDDLVMAVDALALMGIDEILLDPLLERAMELLETHLETVGAVQQPLPWGFMENRPALRLLAHRAFRDLHGGGGGSADIEAAERLIGLNPHDNHGIRQYLSRSYLMENRPGQALALCDRYPDDFCAMMLDRILAQYRLGLTEDALESLRAAAGYHGVAIKMLLAANPRQPSMSGYGIQLGGKDEAWEYRAGHRTLWEQDGALEWLRTQWKKIPNKSRL